MTPFDGSGPGARAPKAHGFLTGWGIAVVVGFCVLSQQPALAGLMILTP